MTEKPRIGMVGLGRMGFNMACRLVDAGYPVTRIYDVRPDLARDVAPVLGAHVSETLAGVTGGADVILTVVGNDSDMDRIFARQGDSLLSGAGGKVFLNCATVLPETHLETERRCREAGAHSLEVSMAGSIPQARSGTLYLIVGGDRAVYDRMHPVLLDLSESMVYMGVSGQAATMKALVNMVMNINTAGLAEGLGLAAARGLDLTLVREVFSKTGAASRVLETDGADMQNREHDVYFSAAHAAKDTHIALTLAQDAGITLPLARATAGQYDRMVSLGLGELDKSGISELTFPDRTAGQHNPSP